MRVFYGLDKINTIPNPVITTGSFDGVHLGHRTIISRINALAQKSGGESVLITFDPHPRKVLYPKTIGKELRLITTLNEKIELLKSVGLQNLVVIHFTPEFSQMSSVDFIREILVGNLHAHKVVVGFNHQFGHNREGNFEYLYELGQFYGFGVEEIPEQDIDNETVSSTKIRSALSQGRIQRANAYLDHYYFISAKLIKGNEVMSRLDFPSYRLLINDEIKLVPPVGVYAISIQHEGQLLKGMLNIRPGTDSVIPRVDFHLFSKPERLDLSEVKVCFHKRIRDEMDFSSQAALRKQLTRDRNEITDLIY
ncbi:MAG: riboflavin biosynthesis protein RibF [Bacteroidota bacterium]|nr:riboflavin biosynthesis protein RibF [Bacteroidota bacterium]